jgi:ATP-binding cassette, subfamily B, multidrug efflux pump
VKELKHLNKYLIRYKYHLLLGTVFVIISNVFQIIPAQLVRLALDLVVDNLKVFNVYQELSLQDIYKFAVNNSILIYGAIILLMALLRGFFLFLVRQTLIVMSRHIEYDLKNDIYRHYQSLPLSFYKQNNTGDLMARISEDVSRVRMYIGPAIMYGMNLVVLFLILIPYMLSVNVRLTLFALLPLPILSVSIYFVNNIINKRAEEIQRSLSNLSTFVQEAFSGIRVLKSFYREEERTFKFAQASDEYKAKSLRLTRINSLFFPLIMALIGLSTILTVYVGGNEVIRGTLSFGNIAEFIIYVSLLTWPVTSLGWITSIIQRAAASQKRINEFLFIKSDIDSKKNLSKTIAGKIVFENVSFVYPDSGIRAIDHVSFEVSEGQSIAVIGSTGSGKSTIANLLCRMYDTTEGRILIDNIDIRDYNISSLRSQIGYVPQDVFLFSDTLENNIAFGSMEFDETQTIKAAQDADLYHNIIDFPEGFKTKVGERGITLSGGQKQRLSIARAIIRDPQILILDDCLSAVDTKTENTILNSMKRIMMGRTSIIISHRVSSAKLADHIIVLDDGKLIEYGNHDFLMDQNGVYRELYEKQLMTDEVVEK